MSGLKRRMLDHDSDEDLDSVSENNSIDSSTDTSDFESSESDENDQKFKMKCPAIMILYGPSQSGKSTFMLDMIFGRHFAANFRYVYLCIGVRAEADAEHKLKPLISAIVSSMPDDITEESSVKVFSSFELLHEHLRQVTTEEKNSPKLVIFDDMMTSDKKPKNVDSLFTEMAHHHNACMISSMQNLFIKEGRLLRDQGRYIVLFPGIPHTTLSRFLNEYAQSVKDTVKAFIKTQGSDPLLKKYDVRFKVPVIIDNLPDKNEVDKIVWRSLEDDDPVEINSDESSGDNINALGVSTELVTNLFRAEAQKARAKKHRVD